MSYDSDVQSYNDDKEDSRECEAMRKMFVGGLSRSTQEDAFYEHFSQYGDIVDKVIIVDPHTKESRGFGFVTFSSSQNVENAFKGRPHNLDSKPLDIKRAMPREYNTPGAHAKTKKLFVGGLAPDTTPEELRSYIESRHPTTFGRIEKIDFFKDRTTSKNKGFGFLECTDNDFADRLAISENSMVLGGKKMSIKKAEPREGQDDYSPRGGRGSSRGGPGRGRGGDRGGRGGGDRGSSRGRGGQRGGYDGGYGGGYGGGGGQSYSTSYPTTRGGGGGGGGGYSSSGYNQGQPGGYGQGGNDGGGYSSGGGAGGYSAGGGYSSGGGADGYSSGGGGFGGYSAGGDGGYSQGGGYGSRGGGGRGGRGGGGGGGGGGQRYQPY